MSQERDHSGGIFYVLGGLTGCVISAEGLLAAGTNIVTYFHPETKLVHNFTGNIALDLTIDAAIVAGGFIATAFFTRKLADLENSSVANIPA